MFIRGMSLPVFACALALAAGLAAGCGSDYRNDAEKQFLKAAKRGDAEAQYNLGACYEFGGGAERNIDRAKSWYELAAKQGHAKAAERLRVLNPPTAAQAAEYRDGAKRGDAEAQYGFAQCCEYGFHMKKDLNRAMRVYRLAADKGHAGAKQRFEALRQSMTPKTAMLRKYAADARKGDPEAQFQLAQCYDFGLRVRRNSALADDLYRKAARQGHAGAMDRLNWKPRKNPAPPKKPTARTPANARKTSAPAKKRNPRTPANSGRTRSAGESDRRR